MRFLISRASAKPIPSDNVLRRRGFIIALISSATFGMVPFFTIPAQKAGMSVSTLLVYRYILASIALLIPVIVTRTSLKLTKGDFWKLMGLSGIFVLTSVTMFEGYKHIDSGAATTLQYSYPVFAPILTYFMYKEKLNKRTIIAIVMALFGCTCMSGLFSEPSSTHDNVLWGAALELMSGLLFAVYLVLIPKAKFSKQDMNSSKLTFYVFFFGAFYSAIYALCDGGIEWWGHYSTDIIIKIIILAFIPSAFATITLNMSVKIIGSTLSSILSAMEPVTAMILGILFLGDQPDKWAYIGFVVIIAAVFLVVLKSPGKDKIKRATHGDEHPAEAATEAATE